MMRKIWIICMLSGFALANTFVDKSTNLMWQDNHASKSLKKSWSGAKEYCENLSLNGYDDWYLPSVEQLLTITDKTKYNPSVKRGIKNITSNDYWSASSSVSFSSFAWYVNFKYGLSYGNDKSYEYYVRCVRSGQSDTLTFENFNKTVEQFIKKELQNIPKPPSTLNLVKDEFETTSEFEKRVKQARTKQREAVALYELQVEEARAGATQSAVKKALQYTWGKPLLSNLKYDADNGYFLANLTFDAKKSFKKKVAIKVSRRFAREFKRGFRNLKPQAVFEYEDGTVSLSSIRVPHKGRNYLAEFTDLSLNETRMAVNLTNEFSGIKAHASVKIASSKVSRFDVSNLSSFGDLELLLKSSQKVKPSSTKWLVIVGIEEYDYADNLEYSSRSAKMFAKVAQNSLGIPTYNTLSLLDKVASMGKIKMKLKRLMRRVKRGDTIYFYYSGHGIPVATAKNEPYILPSDIEPEYISQEKFFKLSNIYKLLSSSKASKVVAFVDSCFSGATDGKSVIKGVAAARLVPKKVTFDKSKMVVLSAGQKSQYSNMYKQKGHRLFSYFVMKSLLEGKTDIKDIYYKVHTKVKEESYKMGDMNLQEPTVDGNLNLKL